MTRDWIGTMSEKTQENGEGQSFDPAWAKMVAAGHPSHIRVNAGNSAGHRHPAHIPMGPSEKRDSDQPHSIPPVEGNTIQPHDPLAGLTKTSSATSKAEILDDLFLLYAAKPTDNPLASAFERKFSVHAMGNGEGSLPTEELPLAFSDMFQEKLIGPVVLYIHIPFCSNQCIYCGFRGISAKSGQIQPYVNALLKELQWIGRTNAAESTILAVSFGGGTPSVLDPEMLATIVRTVKDNFNLANDCELSLEGCVRDFTPERSEAFVNAGFNRFSLGVQSFDSDIRHSIGRMSDRDTVIANMSHLIGLDMGAVVLDLIYGLPGQSVSMFLDDIALAEGLGVDGLDTYQLNVFPGGELDQALRNGKLPPVAPLQDQGRYYEQAADMMQAKRWRQISLSHFAMTYRERNLYNPVAKRQGNCIGCGAGAGGCLNGWSYYRPPAVPRYMAMAEADVFTPVAVMLPSSARRIVSELIGQVEMGFLEPDYFRRRLAIDLSDLDPIFRNWEAAGLLIDTSKRYELTRAGQFWGVNISHALVKIINVLARTGNNDNDG